MDYEHYSCIDCIWHDQCESDEPCDFFDPGRSSTDEEIELEAEILRREYIKDYQEYLEGE